MYIQLYIQMEYILVFVFLPFVICRTEMILKTIESVNVEYLAED